MTLEEIAREFGYEVGFLADLAEDYNLTPEMIYDMCANGDIAN